MGKLVLYYFAVAFLILAFFIAISAAMKTTEKAAFECEVITGGHFVNSRGYECWSQDGTKRLFPSEKF